MGDLLKFVMGFNKDCQMNGIKERDEQFIIGKIFGVELLLTFRYKEHELTPEEEKAIVAMVERRMAREMGLEDQSGSEK